MCFDGIKNKSTQEECGPIDPAPHAANLKKSCDVRGPKPHVTTGSSSHFPRFIYTIDDFANAFSWMPSRNNWRDDVLRDFSFLKLKKRLVFRTGWTSGRIYLLRGDWMQICWVTTMLKWINFSRVRQLCLGTCSCWYLLNFRSNRCGNARTIFT